MRKLFVILLVTTLSIVSIPMPAHASQPRQLSPGEAGLVAQNCVVAQGSMQRLGNSDLATRVTRGRVYDYLLAKLITPLNARVILNRYNASELTATTTNIQQKFLAFKDDYTKYEAVMADAIAYDCKLHPQEFYSRLENARELRSNVANDLKDLDRLFNDYQTAIDNLTALIPESVQ